MSVVGEGDVDVGAVAVGRPEKTVLGPRGEDGRGKERDDAGGELVVVALGTGKMAWRVDVAACAESHRRPRRRVIQAGDVARLGWCCLGVGLGEFAGRLVAVAVVGAATAVVVVTAAVTAAGPGAAIGAGSGVVGTRVTCAEVAQSLQLAGMAGVAGVVLGG